jgi:GT2 family glycosyltransferase
MKLWIVVVNYNGQNDTRKCLRSLAPMVSDSVSVVVVDNASAEDPAPALREEFPWCHLVHNSVNGGWAGGNNTGIRYALERDADQVFLLNNDTTVAPDLVDVLLATAAANPGYGVLGPIIFSMDDPAAVMTDGFLFNTPGCPIFFERKVVPLTPAAPPAVTDVDIVNGCAMMIGRRVLERIGLIDERFFLIHEESDFCLRAKEAGFGCGVLSRGLVWHKGSTSFKRSGKRWQRYYDARNLALLLRKHPAANHPRRGAWPSRLAYLKYVYYRYAIEREEGHPDAALAVLEGVCDALARRYGAYEAAPRPALAVVRPLFEFWFTRRKKSATATPTVHAEPDA